MLFYVLNKQFHWKQLSIADFTIVDKDGLFWLSIVTSPQFDGLVQDCSNSSALAMELLQSCAKPSSWSVMSCERVVLRLWRDIRRLFMRMQTGAKSIFTSE